MMYFNYLWDLSFGSVGSEYHRGDGTTTLPETTEWIDNEGNPMRDNLGNVFYFNRNEAAQ